MKTPQLDPLPGCGSLGLARPVARDLADLAQRKANAPLRPTVPQRDPGGLFGDSAAQTDIADFVGRPLLPSEKPRDENYRLIAPDLNRPLPGATTGE